MKVAIFWKGLSSVACMKNVTNITWNENTFTVTGVVETSTSTTPVTYTYNSDQCIIRILEN